MVKTITNALTETRDLNFDASKYPIGEDVLTILDDSGDEYFAASIWVNNHDFEKQAPKDNFFELQVARVICDPDGDNMEVTDVLYECELPVFYLKDASDNDIIDRARHALADFEE